MVALLDIRFMGIDYVNCREEVRNIGCQFLICHFLLLWAWSTSEIFLAIFPTAIFYWYRTEAFFAVFVLA